MKKKLKDNQNKIIYSVIALACFLIVTGLAVMLQSRDNQKQQYAMVILGDSIVGQHRNETSVPAQIGVLLGQAVYNGAMGGTCMSCMDEDKRVAYTKDSLSVVSLAEAIATEDFGTQQTARIRESGTEHFVQVIDELEAVDYDTVDTILLCAGINDYHAGITIYPEKDLYDEYTFTGALRSAVRDIQEAYPDIRVVLVTPTYTWYQEGALTCEEYNLGGGLLKDYVEAEIEIAKEMDIEVIDLYHEVYPHEVQEDWMRYTIDGVHPNEAGRTLLAETIATKLTKTN